MKEEDKFNDSAQSKRKPPIKGDVETLSEYARFHFRYLGFNFKNNRTEKILTKGKFWESHKELAQDSLKIVVERGKKPPPPPGFSLVEYT